MPSQQTVSDLVTTLTRWGEKGTLKKATADNLRGSCERVFKILENPEREEVAKIDLTSALQRFHNLNPSVSSASLRVYKSRVETAVKLFLAFKKDPINWKPDFQTRSGRTGTAKTRPQAETAKSSEESEAVEKYSTHQPHAATPSAFVSTLTIPFPLRADVTISIAGVPRDLTNSECERIAAFLKPLAIDFGKKGE